MNTLKWAVIAMAAVAMVWAGQVAGEEPPPDADMEWLEMGPGPGPGPEAGPGPGSGMGPGPGMEPGPGRDRPGIDRPGRDRDGKGREGMLDRIKKEDPERFKRIEQIKKLADKYRQTGDEKERARIEKELRPLVEAELKVQQDENVARVERLEKKLAHFKEVLKKREQNWDKVVDYTIKDITGQNDYLKMLPGAGNRRKK